MGPISRLIYRQDKADTPDHRTEVVLAKLNAAVQRFEHSKDRVYSILDEDQPRPVMEADPDE